MKTTLLLFWGAVRSSRRSLFGSPALARIVAQGDAAVPAALGIGSQGAPISRTERAHGDEVTARAGATAVVAPRCCGGRSSPPWGTALRRRPSELQALPAGRGGARFPVRSPSSLARARVGRRCPPLPRRHGRDRGGGGAARSARWPRVPGDTIPDGEQFSVEGALVAARGLLVGGEWAWGARPGRA